jgi:hypothetical protein
MLNKIQGEDITGDPRKCIKSIITLFEEPRTDIIREINREKRRCIII